MGIAGRSMARYNMLLIDALYRILGSDILRSDHRCRLYAGQPSVVLSECTKDVWINRTENASASGSILRWARHEGIMHREDTPWRQAPIQMVYVIGFLPSH